MSPRSTLYSFVPDPLTSSTKGWKIDHKNAQVSKESIHHLDVGTNINKPYRNHLIMIRSILINEVARRYRERYYHHGSVISSARSNGMSKNECAITSSIFLIILLFPVMGKLRSMDDTCYADCSAKRSHLLILAIFMAILILFCSCYLVVSYHNRYRNQRPLTWRGVSGYSSHSNHGIDQVFTTTIPSIVTNTDTIITPPRVSTTTPTARRENDVNEATDDPPPSFESVIVDVEQPPPEYETCVRATHVDIDHNWWKYYSNDWILG